jgi:hypothetical protein
MVLSREKGLLFHQKMTHIKYKVLHVCGINLSPEDSHICRKND